MGSRRSPGSDSTSERESSPSRHRGEKEGNRRIRRRIDGGADEPFGGQAEIQSTRQLAIYSGRLSYHSAAAICRRILERERERKTKGETGKGEKEKEGRARKR